MPLAELQPNSHGAIKVNKLGPKKYQAVCLFRPGGGKPVKRKASASSRNEAQRALEDKIKRERGRRAGELDGGLRFEEIAWMWLDLEVKTQKAPTTYDGYRQRLLQVTVPEFGNYRLHEITPAILYEFLFERLPDMGHGFHARRSIRSTISGPLRYAVRRGALERNPLRDVERIERLPSEPEPRVTSLTEQDRMALLRALKADRYAAQNGLYDLVHFMLKTGCRIGEALAVTWGDFDSEFKWIRISRNTVTVRGKYTQLQSGKTESARRRFELPNTLAWELANKYRDSPRPLDEPVFGTVPRDGSVQGGLVHRDRSNCAKALRRFIRRSGYSPSDPTIRVVTHLFRRTAVTRMHSKGASTRDISHQVGHANPAITHSLYIGRGRNSSAGALALEDEFDETELEGLKPQLGTSILSGVDS